jgi:UDP-glucose:(glucosyl)LPS alpha-1,3-glucosyltransferase/UDP-glucose:(galactosyl)LPS alpha-1,2-glucosyltransferase
MRTAYCFTPDRAFFAPAVRAIASLIDAEPEVERDILLVCEPDDVLPGFDRLAPASRERIELVTVDFSRFDHRLSPRGRFSRAVFRRLFLDAVLPDRFERIVTVDSDMLIVRPGLARLAEIDLGGRPLAAAMDMIFLMDFRNDWLARRFQTARRALGLDLATPYCNAGLMTIDRERWRELKVTERVVEALAAAPERYPFMEQDALNSILCGNFAMLSPRFNFMGDFFLIDLEREIEPIVLHFVNSPKPWELASWQGEARFAQNYRDWFERSPWPEFSEAPAAPLGRRTRPRLTAARRRFRQGLKEFLARQSFVDR